MLTLKLKQGAKGRSLKPGALSHFGWESSTLMLTTWVDRWSMKLIVGAKVLDPILRSLRSSWLMNYAYYMGG